MENSRIGGISVNKRTAFFASSYLAFNNSIKSFLHKPYFAKLFLFVIKNKKFVRTEFFLLKKKVDGDDWCKRSSPHPANSVRLASMRLSLFVKTAFFTRLLLSCAVGWHFATATLSRLPCS